MNAEERRSLTAIIALAVSTMGISLSWTGMKLPEMLLGFKFLDMMSGWSMSYFIIAEVAIMPFAGKLIDMYGTKTPLACGLGLFLAGSAVAMFAEDGNTFLVGRIVQGLGAGMIFSVSMTAVGLLFRGHAMRRLHGVMTGAFAIGSLFGFAFGYWICSTVEADYFVPVCAFIAVSGGVVGYLHLPDSKPCGTHDTLGTVLITLFMLVIVTFTQTVNKSHDLVSVETAALVAVAVALLAALWFVERRAVDPIFPRTEGSSLVGCILCMFLAGFCGLGIIQYLTRFLIIGMEMGIYETSSMFLVFLAGAVITSFGISRVLGRTGLRRWVLVGPVIVFCALLFASQTLIDGIEYVGISMLVLGLGLGCIVTPALCSLHASTRREILGSTTSIVLAFRFVGILCGIAIYAGIISWKLEGVLANLREIFGHATLDLITTIMMLIGDVFDGALATLEDSIMLCCMAAGVLSLSILAAAFFTIEPGFGKDEAED